jgi:hypothetical protein
MSSLPTEDIIPSALAAKNRTFDHAGTQTVLVDAVVAGIHTAVTAGSYTATVAEGSATSADIQWVIEALRQGGYTVTTSTTNLVITWTL